MNVHYNRKHAQEITENTADTLIIGLGLVTGGWILLSMNGSNHHWGASARTLPKEGIAADIFENHIAINAFSEIFG